jgi:hypothetical protein
MTEFVPMKKHLSLRDLPERQTRFHAKAQNTRMSRLPTCQCLSSREFEFVSTQGAVFWASREFVLSSFASKTSSF